MNKDSVQLDFQMLVEDIAIIGLNFPQARASAVDYQMHHEAHVDKDENPLIFRWAWDSGKIVEFLGPNIQKNEPCMWVRMAFCLNLVPSGALFGVAGLSTAFLPSISSLQAMISGSSYGCIRPILTS